MAVATLDQIRRFESKALRNQIKRAELQTKLKAEQDLNRELRRRVRDRDQELEGIEAGEDGIITGLIAVVSVAAGGAVGWAIQRKIEGKDWTDTVKAPMGVPLVGLVALPLILPAMFIPNRYGVVAGPAVIVGILGGSILGHVQGGWE